MTKLWMALDALAILTSALLATLYYRVHERGLRNAREFWHGTLIHHRAMGILLVLLCFFAISLIMISRRLNLYSPTGLGDTLHEQRLSVQACLTSGLLLTGALYLLRLPDVPRSIVLITVGLVTIALSLRRAIYRILLYRGFARGVGTRNVLIVGTGPKAIALRFYLESIRHLGYKFKGFIESPDTDEDSGLGTRFVPARGDVAGTLDTLFQQARKLFVDEIFFTTHCEPSVVESVLEQARAHRVDLRMVPEMLDDLTLNSPIEYVGQFPTIPLYRGQVNEIRRVFKRALDMVFSSVGLILLSPVLLAVAIAVKLDSPGPVFYFSERIGKKGRVFRCIRFRAVVRGAVEQRDGAAREIAGDPRTTRLGRFLRRYSLDELPQLFNVLRGDMSVVGPRPLRASDAGDSKLTSQRSLAVPPGLTGLWPVLGRQDPPSDSYISLDLLYIENWSVWLDIQIILRTMGMVFAGTGV